MYEVLNLMNCKRNAQLRTLRCVAWLVTAATRSNAQLAMPRNAQRSVSGHGPLNRADSADIVFTHTVYE